MFQILDETSIKQKIMQGKKDKMRKRKGSGKGQK